MDDDPRLLALLGTALEESGHRVQRAASAEEASRFLVRGPGEPELLLLDVGLPGLDGWEFLEQLRSQGWQLPVLYLTARQAIEDRVRGLQLGADDYVVKPFALQELLARMQAVVRRHTARDRRVLGGLEVDRERRTARVGEREVELSPRECELLEALVEQAGAEVTRRDLLRRVWGMGFEPGTNVVEVNVSRLRRKVRHLGVELVRGEQGYRVLAPGVPPGPY